MPSELRALKASTETTRDLPRAQAGERSHQVRLDQDMPGHLAQEGPPGSQSAYATGDCLGPTEGFRTMSLTCDRKGSGGGDMPCMSVGEEPSSTGANSQQEAVITTKPHFKQGSRPRMVTI